jgi:hypothetical protein
VQRSKIHHKSARIWTGHVEVGEWLMEELIPVRLFFWSNFQFFRIGISLLKLEFEHDYLAILEFSGWHTSQKFEEESAIFKQIN